MPNRTYNDGWDVPTTSYRQEWSSLTPLDSRFGAVGIMSAGEASMSGVGLKAWPVSGWSSVQQCEWRATDAASRSLLI